MRQRGFVKNYNPEAGFGFIESAQGEELFVHHTGLCGVRCLEHGMEVEFEAREPGCATEVIDVSPRRTKAALA